MKTPILIATHCTSSSGGRGRMRTISKSKRSLMIRNFTPSPSITREHGCSASPTKSSGNTHAVKTTWTRIILGLGRDLFVPTARGDLSSRRRLRAGAGETSHKMRKIHPLPLGALHKKSWAVIDRPYSLGFAAVGALYERPRCIFCAKPRLGEGDSPVADSFTAAKAERSLCPAPNFLRSSIHVLYISFVFQTYKLEQLGIGYENLVYFEAKRLGVGLRIVDCDLDLQVSEVHPSEPLRQLGGIRQRVASSIQPLPVSKACCLHDQGVALPLPDRVTVPGGLVDRGQTAAVGEDLPEAGVVLVENQKQPWILDDLLEPTDPCVSFDNAYRQTSRDGLAGLGRRVPGLCQFRHSGSIRQTALDARSNVEKLGLPWIVLNVPNPGKVRLAVRCSGRGSREVRFSVPRSRNPRRWMAQPLRKKRDTGRDQDSKNKNGSSHVSLQL